MRIANPVLLSLIMMSAGSAPQADDWALSAEASFMTKDERREWKRLDSVSDRADFKRAYWQRRDPTPETDRNEFREKVLARIEAADERFGTTNQRGSRTARGGVYVLFGPPAVVRVTSGPLDATPRREFPGATTLPRGGLDTTGWEEWVYDREQHADLLKTLRRPLVEITFVVERGRDHLQRPGVFAAYRDAIARSTVVRP